MEKYVGGVTSQLKTGAWLVTTKPLDVKTKTKDISGTKKISGTKDIPGTKDISGTKHTSWNKGHR